MLLNHYIIEFYNKPVFNLLNSKKNVDGLMRKLSDVYPGPFENFTPPL